MKASFSNPLFIVWLMMSLPVLISAPAAAQIKSPAKWVFNAVPTSKGSEALIMCTAMLEPGWHVYSQFIEESGPLPTTFTFTPSTDYSLVGKVKEEGIPVKSYDETFMMDVVWYAKSVTFVQRVKLNVPSATISGNVEFMVCTDKECLLPEVVPFSVKIKVDQPEKKKSNEQAVIPDKKITDTALQVQEAQKTIIADSSTVVIIKDISSPVEKAQAGVIPVNGKSLWSIFIAGFLGGLAALIMPCIFPMIPFTVGIFSKKKKNSVVASLVFGLSIILIYVTLGLLITIIFGSDALNAISTNGIFNFFFFVLLVVFGASFLGAFEISLPSSWVNKADAQADRAGGLGIFFMAATLALVSFSCTGPLVGTLLVEAASLGNYKGPAVGMLGFSIALALPFTLFSMFPAWLKALPKSGGWLNSVKVVLGFLELALALKFLSNVDLAYHWNWFDREVFLVLWIIIFALLGFYLLGKLKFPNDSDVKHIQPARLFMAIITLAFSLYMIPGLLGAPLKVISAFLPPQHTQDFDLYSATLAFPSPAERSRSGEGVPTKVGTDEGSPSPEERAGVRRYATLFHAPHNLNAFFDYDEAMLYAKQVHKPLLIDFTGHACVNCRKMETVVWSDPRILNRIKEDYVLVQLYVDDKTELPIEEQFKSSYSGKQVTTIGNKWSDFQAAVYNANSQPYYVLLDLNEKILIPPQGAEYDIEIFKQYLDNGLAEFKSR